MASLTSLPSLEIIQGFKGTIDYFVTRGITCARRWPRYSKDRMSAPALAAAATFGLIIKAWALVCSEIKEELNLDAADQPRSARDIYIQATYGYLHENQMSDILDSLNAINAHLLNLEELLDALASEATDQVRADVISSALPSGAATQTTMATLALETGGNLAAIKTALQIIDDFALTTNKLFGYNNKWDQNLGGTATGTTYSKTTATVPANEAWILNALAISNQTRATTAIYLQIFRASGGVLSINYAPTLAQWVPLFATGNFPMAEGDYAQIYMASTQAGDTILAGLNGYKMKVA